MFGDFKKAIRIVEDFAKRERTEEGLTVLKQLLERLNDALEQEEHDFSEWANSQSLEYDPGF